MLSVGISPWMSALRRGASPFVLTTLAGGSALPEWLSHSRAGGAMMFDSTGKLTWAPENLVLRSTWVGGTAGAVGSDAVAPTGWSFAVASGSVAYPAALVGGGTAVRTSGTAARPFVQQIVTVAAYTKYMQTVRVDALTTGPLSAANVMTALMPSGTTIYYINGIEVSSGALISAGDVISAVHSIGATGGSATIRFGLGCNGNITGDVTLSAPQVERVTYETSPRTYNPTTSAAYYGPRFDYDPATLAPLGYLNEGARTNDVDNIQAWSTANVTRTASAAVAPTGVTEAYKIEAATTAGTTFNRTVSAAGSTANTYSIFIKKGSGATDANKFAIYNNSTTTELLRVSVDFDAGTLAYIVGSTGATLTPVGNGWYRLTMTVTSGVSTGNALIVYCGFIGAAETAGEYLYAFGPQLEKATFASSYIWTTTAAATRASDVCQIIGQGLIPFQSDYGWAAVQARYSVNTAETGAVIAGSSANNRTIYIPTNPTQGFTTYNGTNALVSSVSAEAAFKRAVFAWNKITPGRRLQATGGTLQSDANTPNIGATTQWVGSVNGTSLFVFVHFQSIALGIGNPSNAEIAAKLTVDGSY
jgi:hypothetical protein